jgi:hypothetical protein
MVGAICKRDILAHPFVTIHCFGWQVFFRALIAGRNQTFLSLLAQTHTVQQPKVNVPKLVGRCVKLELRAKRIFESLASQFVNKRPVMQFFDTLARQEQGHAELLELCREAARRAVWKEEYFAPWRDAVPRLERQMGDAESSLESLDSVADALWLVLQIEGSEVNHVFSGVVAASGSDFVRNVRAFQSAGKKHIAFICEEIPSLEADLAGECRELWAAYFTDPAK